MRAVFAVAGCVVWLGSATPVLAQCAGDCDQSGAVAVNELVLGVNIALERAAIGGCRSLDTDENGRVAVNELVAAVSNALRGCARFAGRYTATVPLDGGMSGVVDLVANANGQVSGTLTIEEGAALGEGQGAATVVDISGQFDPATGTFLVTGSFQAGSQTINVRLSGTLGAAFTLEIGGQSYNWTFGAEPTATPTPTTTPRGTVHMIKVGQPALPFDPEVLEINPGETVVWTWVQGTHSVRSAALNQIGQPSCTADGLFDSGVQSSGTFSHTFTTPGRYGYHCGVAGHCDAFEFGYVEVRGTPTATPTRTRTASPTFPVPTSTPTPETIGGVSTRILGSFSGSATINGQAFPARLQIVVDDVGPFATDLSSPQPFIFPNPVRMTIVSPTELLYELIGLPTIRFRLSLNAEGHVIGRYTNEDPQMPSFPIDYDVTREP